MADLDSTDEQLVRLLGKDARQSSEALAKQLKVSSATVRRRLRKLIRGHLLRIVGIVDPADFGFPVVAMIAFHVTHDKLESAVDKLASRPEVRWVSMTTGRFDIIVLARFRSNADLSKFLTKQLPEIDGLRDSETFTCLDVKKGQHARIDTLA